MTTNDHGWIPVAGFTIDGGSVDVAPIVDERKRCTCPLGLGCRRPATQEDLRCDECRERCP